MKKTTVTIIILTGFISLTLNATVVPSYLINQNFNGVTSHPTGWSFSTQSTAGSLFYAGSYNYTTPADQLNVKGGGSGNRGGIIAYPTFGTGSSSTVLEFDWQINDAKVGRLNALGLFLKDNSLNNIILLYLSGTDGKVHLQNIDNTNPTFNETIGSGSFLKAGSDDAACNSLNASTITTCNWAKNQIVHVKVVLDFINHNIIYIKLRNTTDNSTYEYSSGLAFLSNIGNEISKLAIVNTRPSNLGNGGDASLDNGFDNFQIYSEAYLWTNAAASGNWNTSDLNFSTDASSGINYPGNAAVTFPADASTKTVNVSEDMNLGYYNIDVYGNNYSFTGINKLTGTGVFNLNLASTETATLGFKGNFLSGGVNLTGGTALINADSAGTKYSLANGSKLKLDPFTGFTVNRTFSKPISGSGTINLELVSVAKAKTYTYIYSPVISNVSTVNYYLNPSGEKIRVIGSGGVFSMGIGGGTAPANGTQFNIINSTADGQYFPVASDTYFENQKINLGENISLSRLYSQASGTTIKIGELSGGSTSKITGGISSATNRTVSYYIGYLNTNATFAGQINIYSTFSPVDIHKVGSGTWTLSGPANSGYTKGSIYVDAGELKVTGSLGNVNLINFFSIANGAILSSMDGGRITATKLIMGTTAQLKIGSTSTDSLKYVGGSTLTNVEMQVNGSNGGKFVIVPDSAITIGSLTITSLAAPAIGTQIQLIKATDPTKVTYTNTPIVPSGYSFNVETGILTYNGTYINTDTNLSALTIPTNASITVSSGNLTINQNFAANNLNVAPNAKLSVTGSLTATNLVINSDINGTGTLVNTGTVTITNPATVKQYLPAARNWYISAPITGATVPEGSTYYYYDETQKIEDTDGDHFIAVAEGTGLIPGKGYIAKPAAATTLSFTGSLNDGNQSIVLTRQGTTKAGFNLVGNPYPSYIDAGILLSVNAPEGAAKVESNIWYRTANWNSEQNKFIYQFQTYNASSDETVPLAANPSYIHPMQSFWVRALTHGVELNFTNAMRKHNETASPVLLRAPASTDRQRLRLQVNNGTTTDETLIYFDTNASNAFDRYDASKFSEPGTVTQIFTTAGNEKLVINGMNLLPLDSAIGLGFVAGNATSFSIVANEITNLPSDVRVILIDNAKNGHETDLTDGVTAYEFTPATTSGDRFSIIFRSPGVATGVDNAENTDVNVYVNTANQMVINAPLNSRYAIYNAVGQIVAKGTTTQSTCIAPRYIAGVYMVEVNNAVKKVIVK